MVLFPVIAFITEEATGSINEETISAINETATDAIIPQNLYPPPPLPPFLLFTFYVLLIL